MLNSVGGCVKLFLKQNVWFQTCIELLLFNDYAGWWFISLFGWNDFLRAGFIYRAICLRSFHLCTSYLLATFPSFLPFSCPLAALLLTVESSKHPLGSPSEKNTRHDGRKLQRSSIKHGQINSSLGFHIGRKSWYCNSTKYSSFLKSQVLILHATVSFSCRGQSIPAFKVARVTPKTHRRIWEACYTWIFKKQPCLPI